MVNRKFFLSGVLCLAALATVLQAVTGPTVFVLPNGLGGSNDISTVYSPDPFQTISSVHADPAANLVLETPSGSKYYIISKSGSNTVSVFDASLSGGVASKQISLGNQAKAAAMSVTPSWVRLLVLTIDGILHVIDTGSDTEIARLTVGAGAVDVAVSPEGTRAFVLVTGQLLFYDLTTNTAAGPGIPVGGTVSGVAVAPNGLVYASATNQVLEVDGRTMTLRGTIPLNALPGKLVFTPDGNRALAINQTPVTGSTVVLIDLTSRTVINYVSNFGPTMSKVVVVSNSLAFATSSTNPVLYQMQLPSLNISAPTFLTGVTDVTTSNEYPSALSLGARYLFVTTSGNTVYRVDPTNLQSLSQVSSNAAGAVSYVTPGVTGTPATVIAYNATQAVAPSTVSIPLAVRVLDISGRPLYGVPVTFSTSAVGTTVLTPSVSTNPDGIAETYVTAPATTGVVNVFALAGGLSTTFTLNVGGIPTGGGTGGIQIKMVSGNGQVVPQSFVSAQPLTVLVTDALGNPLPSQPVTWMVTQGNATIQVPVVYTDANGLASTGVLGSSFITGRSYEQSTINASIATGSVNFIVTTLSAVNLPPPAQATLTAQLVKPPQTNRTITGGVGQTLPGAIQVLVSDTLGGPIPNIGVSVSTGLDPAVGPTASCNAEGGTALSDTKGVATCDLVLGGKIGKATLTVTIGGQITSAVTLTITAGAPAQVIILQGNNQSGNPGQTLPQALKAQITDASGNVLSGVQVTWEVLTAGGATLSNVVSTSDGSGNVSAMATLGSTAGAVQIRVTTLIGSASAVFTLSTNVIVAGLQPVSGGGQTAITNQGFAQPLVVLVTDAKSSPVAGATVSFAVTGGSASLSASTVTSDAQGRASVSVTAGSTAGAVVVAASTAGVSTSFNLTVILPGPNVTAAGFVNGAGFQQGVVPGSVVFIAGSGLAPGIQGSVVANSIVGPLPTTLAKVQVLFGSTPAPIYAVNNVNGQESVVVQVPFEVSPGSIPVTINVGGGTTTVTVQVLPYQPGIFEATGSDGRRFAVVLRPDGSFVSPANPAQRGETVQVLVTGLGQISPASGTNRAGIGNQNVVAPVLVGLNNAGVTPISAQYAENMIGVYIVTFQIPANSATGSALNLAVAVGPEGSRVFGNSSSIAVQ